MESAEGSAPVERRRLVTRCRATGSVAFRRSFQRFEHGDGDVELGIAKPVRVPGASLVRHEDRRPPRDPVDDTHELVALQAKPDPGTGPDAPLYEGPFPGRDEAVRVLPVAEEPAGDSV